MEYSEHSFTIPQFLQDAYKALEAIKESTFDQRVDAKPHFETLTKPFLKLSSISKEKITGFAVLM